eukprot:TCALIF_06803-PA protein Name:"Similar to YPEL2 Protein yippee-like 2 (Pongo abelii)" AED:0.42 eAED:0.65 QI:0/0/0/1/1/1/2/0/193
MKSAWSRDPDCAPNNASDPWGPNQHNHPQEQELAILEPPIPGQAMAGGGVSVSSNGGNNATSNGGGVTIPEKSAHKTLKTFRAYLPSCHRTYSCVHCRAHLANHDELISKSFQGSQGRAYLFNSVVNIGCGPAEERILLTGLHAVADIYCDCCKTTLGWKYEQAFESSQKYKEGKYIIELAHMIKENGWENES